jgi:uncharacterized protein (TIGR02145 family)
MEVTAARPASSSDTRTAYAEDGITDAPGLTATWSTGDKLGVIAVHYDSDKGNYYDAPSADNYLVAQGDGGEATMTFTGTPTKSDVDRYRFYYPFPDGTIGKIDEKEKAVIYDFTGQTCNLTTPLAELGKRDLMLKGSAVNPADGPIKLYRYTAVLRFDLKLPQDAGTIDSIEFRKTDGNIPTVLKLVGNTYSDEKHSNILSLKITNDEKAPGARTIKAYMVTPGFRIDADDVITVRAIADDAVYSHTFAPFSLYIQYDQVHTFAPEAELVKEKVTAWAGSNIYWDNEARQLTFDPAGTTEHQYYQGVFFKWGSLVGISPALINLQDWTGETTVYRPSYNADKSENSTWEDVEAKIMKYNNLTDIPYYEETDASMHNAGKNSLYNKQNLWKDCKGDICQYLGATNPALKGYRMPRAEEFGTYDDWELRTDGDWKDEYKMAEKNGTANLGAKGYLKHKSGIIFPAAGFRLSNGSVQAVGQNGVYWSSSARSTVIASALIFSKSLTKSNVTPDFGHASQIACSVRCIKEE